MICIAEVCFKETLTDVSNAVQHCSENSGSISCSYMCENGYVFYGGDIRRTAYCPGMNVWNYSPYPDCSLNETIFCNILYKGFVKYVIYKVIFVKLSDWSISTSLFKLTCQVFLEAHTSLLFI